MNDTILEVIQLKKHFLSSRRIIRAVDNVSLSIRKGEVLGLVGESGCGKSTLARLIVRLYQPTDGTIKFNNRDIFRAEKKEALDLCREIQMIFQDPYASLNPRMTAENIIGEAFDIHSLCDGKDRKEKIEALLGMVGLDRTHMSRYPHELSGGQRQRIGIARALAVNPSLIICDEPISALDVSVQAQIMNLLTSLLRQQNLTYLFISHNLAMVKYISNRVAVMYMGKIVETGETSELCGNPRHPYTKALLSAVPIPDPRLAKASQRVIIAGETPESMDTLEGCRFRARCPHIEDICSRETPLLRETSTEHYTACHMF